MPITVIESAVSNAERRGLAGSDGVVTVRVADIYAALPSIAGKIELEYEGELQGAEQVALDLIARACADTFDQYFREEDAAPIIQYFDEGGALRVSETAQDSALLEGFGIVTGLLPSPLEQPKTPASGPPAPQSEADAVVTQLFRHIRYLLTLKGRPPFRLAGIETYERLHNVAGFSLDLLATRFEPRVLQLYQGLQSALSASRSTWFSSFTNRLRSISPLMSLSSEVPRNDKPCAGSNTSTL